MVSVPISEVKGFKRIDHVGIAVADLDAALPFYTEVLGMSLTHQEINEEQGVREAMLTLGESTIQLLSPISASSPIASFLEKRGPGLQQIAYEVEDVAAASDALRKKGMVLLYDQPRRGTAGSLINFIHPKSAGGVLIELVQH